MEYDEFQQHMAMKKRIQELETENARLRSAFDVAIARIKKLDRENDNLRTAHRVMDSELARIRDELHGV